MTQQPRDRLRTSPPAWTLLQDKILVHTRTSIDRGDLVKTGRAHGGVTFCAADAVRIARQCHFQLPKPWLQLVDPEGYKEYATPDTPFEPYGPTEPKGSVLFGGMEEDNGLQRGQDVQVAAGTAAALTPTRYIKGGDRPVVTAAVNTVRTLNPERTILTVPLDQRWLRDDADIDFLITTLNGLPHIKAVALGATLDPLERKGTATGLRRLITGLDRAALIRTDLAGLDAYAHGALFASIGMQTPLRHIRPPNASGPPRTREVTTTVLHPHLMRYFKADTLQDLYGETPAPLCPCAECDGKPLARFHHTAEDQRAANRHNLATWLPWARELQRTPPGQPRRAAWQEYCWNAVQAHGQLLRKLASPGALEVPQHLKEWAREPD